MDVRLPDGTIIKGVPDGMSKADLSAKLAKNGYDVSKLNTGPDYNQIPRTGPGDPGYRAPTAQDIQRGTELAAPERTYKDDTLLGRAFGPFDAATTVLSSMAGGAVAPIGGFIKSAISGGDPEANAGQIAQAMQYQPRTGTGAQLSALVGKAAAPLVALPTATLAQGAQAVGSGATALRGLAGPNAAAMAAQEAQMVAGAPKMTATTLADLVRAPKTAAMPGVGAAETADAAQRAQRFANMRAPMQPTKGILTRSIDDVQFEREAAKRPEGKALDNRFAELNKGMEQHMDALVDETGATASSARATGKAVVNALEAKRTAKKAEINNAYDAARKAGELEAPIDVTALQNFVNENRGKSKLAPIINTIESEMKKNGTVVDAGVDALMNPKPGKVTMSIQASEDLRQAINKLAEPGTPNQVYGKEAQKIIDAATEGQGGPAYQQARRLYENYSKEFTNRDVIDKVLRTKRGTQDRAVAYEDVADHILMDGSLDDVKHAFRVLQAHPANAAPEVVAAGQQAAKELRGAAAAKLKERMFSNAGADSAGRVVGSEAQIKRIVSELDKDGKLEFLFGKQGAAEIRDTVQVATDLYSTPKGTVNSSNTASAMEKVLDRLAGVTGGTPLVGHAVKYAAKKLESRNYSKKVDAALNPPQNRTLSDMTRGQ